MIPTYLRKLPFQPLVGMRQFFKHEELFIEFITKIGAAGKLHGQRPSENFGGLK